MKKPLKQHDCQLRDIIRPKLRDTEYELYSGDGKSLANKLWLVLRKQFFDTIHDALTYELWGDQ